MTNYIIVHDMGGVLNPYNCSMLGIPEGTTFGGLRNILISMKNKGSGYLKTKDGKSIWVAPFTSDNNLILNPNINIYEVLTLDEFNSFGFDVIDDYV